MKNEAAGLSFAVMGNPIAHSLSPVIHREFAAQTGIKLSYRAILVEKNHFPRQVKEFFAQGGQGLNVTLPFKEEAYALALSRTPRCQVAGAANTLWMQNSELQADNTDGVGLVRDLANHLDLAGQRVLLLGAGGAARGIIAPLLGASIASLTVLNRTFARALSLFEEFPQIHCVPHVSRDESYDLIINASSAGLHQKTWTWDLPCVTPITFCYDLVYALDKPTAFVSWAKACGARAVDGLGMLVEQAAEAFFLWHGVMPKTASVLHRLKESQWL